MKTGLVMEGGAMRGMFTAGVTDVLMENGIEFDGAIGTSAGAVFGCNYKSHQIGRSVRYNKKYCKDKRYVSIRSWITTGDLYSAEFGYHKIPNELDPFDVKAFQSSPMEFYAVCTDAETGKAVYRKCEKCDEEDIQWLRASASMPLASRLVNINGRLYSDGGAADSVPLRYFQSIGYGRNVVILTQPLEYVKKKNSLMPILKIALRKYPMLVEALKTRHVRYNKDIEYIKEQEKLGVVLAVRPPMPLKIGAVEHNPDELERVYQIGRATAEGRLDEIKQFINESGNIK